MFDAANFCDLVIAEAFPTDRMEQTLAYRIDRAYGTEHAYRQATASHGVDAICRDYFEPYAVVLQPKQLAFLKQVIQAERDDGPNEFAFGGARGPGKSFALFAIGALYWCQKYPGLKLIYLRKTGKAAAEQSEDVAQRVLEYFPGKTINQARVAFDNGSRILIGGFKDDNSLMAYQGQEYDGLLIEELTQVRERSYIAVRASARSSKVYGRVPFRPFTMVSFNPLGIGHADFKRRFVDNERKRALGQGDNKRRFVQATVDDNAFVGDEYKLQLEDFTGAELRAYRYGDWDVSAGAYFEQWRYQTHVVPPPEVRHHWRFFASMDYGFNHWNVTQLHVDIGDGQLLTVAELRHRRHHPHQIAPEIHAMLARWGLRADDLHLFVVGTDAFAQTGRSEYTIADQYAKNGVMLAPADMSAGSRVAGAHLMARLLGDPDHDVPPRWQVASNCAGLVETLPYLERNPHNPEDVRKVDADEQGRGGDDSYDCARYGLYAWIGDDGLTVGGDTRRLF